MTVSLYSNEYVARIERDRAILLELVSMYAKHIEKNTDPSVWAPIAVDYDKLMNNLNAPLPPRRNSASNG